MQWSKRRSERGNAKRALECVEEALDVHPDEPRLSAAMARYLERLGRIEDARTAIASAIDLDPDNPDYQEISDRLWADEDLA